MFNRKNSNNKIKDPQLLLSIIKRQPPSEETQIEILNACEAELQNLTRTYYQVAQYKNENEKLLWLNEQFKTERMLCEEVSYSRSLLPILFYLVAGIATKFTIDAIDNSIPECTAFNALKGISLMLVSGASFFCGTVLIEDNASRKHFYKQIKKEGIDNHKQKCDDWILVLKELGSQRCQAHHSLGFSKQPR